MLERERHNLILKLVEERSIVSVADLLDLLGASEATIERHGQLAVQHTRILAGDQCPHCGSTHTMSNSTSGQCGDCEAYWDFAEWECVRVENGRLVRAELD